MPLAQNSQPLELAEALGRLFDTIPVLRDTETVAVTDARGRYLAADVKAPVDLPPFPASAMDGYAVNRTDIDRSQIDGLTRVGVSRAGHPWDGTLAPGQCIRIFTGAKVPAGADQILLQEEVAEDSGDRVRFKAHQPAETYVRPIGHDVARGQLVASRGDRAHPMLQGALASAGISKIDVVAKPRVGVFSTGDELVDPGMPLGEGQIYDSNRLAVINLLAALPVEVVDLGRLPDDESAVRAALEAASDDCNVLITSGGVSVGEADFITATIAALGELEFWRLNLKPGKPLAFGRVGECFVYGLPGNPVSTIVTFLLVAKPAVAHLCGARDSVPRRFEARLAAPLSHSPGRAEYQRGRLQHAEQGLEVRVTGDQSSNRLSTFREANCLIEVPGPAGDLPAGSVVQVIPFDGLLA